jgi:hypothetical protein
MSQDRVIPTIPGQHTSSPFEESAAEELQSSDGRHDSDDESDDDEEGRRSTLEEAWHSAQAASPSSPEGSYGSNDLISSSMAEEIVFEDESSRGSDHDVAGLVGRWSDSQAGAAGISPSAVISTDALKSLLQLVQTCPYDKEIHETVWRNSQGSCQHHSPMLTRHAVSVFRSSRVSQFRDLRIQSNGGDTEDERMWRTTYAQKAVGMSLAH